MSLATSVDTSQIKDHGTLVDDLIESVVRPVFAEQEIGRDRKTRILVNHDGVIRAGGPATHSGSTGRKTAVDT